MSYIFEGLANKRSGDRLQISESAVKASLQQLFAKTGVRTRSQLYASLWSSTEISSSSPTLRRDRTQL